MKKILTGSLFFLAALLLRAQTDDKVLLRIGDREILRSEFEYAYRKNGVQHKMLLSDFLQSFIRLKLRALEAESRGLDTLPAFRSRMEALMQGNGRRTGEPMGPCADEEASQTKLAHLFIYLPQDASSRTLQEACSRMDSIYRAAVSGRLSFESCVCRYADAPSEGIYGEWTTLPACRTVEEVERAVASLRAGELSRPFVSPVGVHLLQALEPDGGRTADERDAGTPPSGEEKEPDYWRTEWRDAALGEALEKEEGASEAEPEQLAAFFKKHKKRYGWELPHYKGGILFGKDKASVKAVAGRLKGVPVGQWAAVAEAYSRTHPGKEVKAESGLFRIGSNAAIDKTVFGQGAYRPPSDYPCIKAIGKKLKKGPETYEDVRARVEDDYKAFRQSEETAGWLRKYKVEINQEVLKTVNNH